MIFFANTVVSFVAWILRRFGIEIDFHTQGIVDSLDEHELREQLHYGRE
jgi:hypothetical protein